MKVLILGLSCLIGIASFAQNLSPASPAKTTAPAGVLIDSLTGQTVVCKGKPLPDGLVVSGEMFTDSCQSGAWIVKPKAGPRPALHVTTAPGQ